MEKGGRKGYITKRNGRVPENGKESSQFAHANGINEWESFLDVTDTNVRIRT